MLQKKLWVIGCLLLMTGILFGAFAAHGLKHMISAPALAILQTGVQYQMYHGLGLLALSACPLCHGRWFHLGAWLLVMGIVLFSGSLYALSLSGLKGLGAITPLGGVALILGWGCLAFSVQPRQE